MAGLFGAFFLGRRIKKMRRTKIADLAPGNIAKVVGRARSIGEPLMSPFTGRPAAAFRVRGYRIEREGRGERIVDLDDVEEGHVFLIDDESGTACVERRGWSRLLVPEIAVSHPEPYDAGYHVERYFERYGQERRTFFDGWDTFRRARYFEWVVPEGAMVAVLGEVERSEVPIEPPAAISSGYRDAPNAMSLVPPGNDRLTVSVDPKHHR